MVRDKIGVLFRFCDQRFDEPRQSVEVFLHPGWVDDQYERGAVIAVVATEHQSSSQGRYGKRKRLTVEIFSEAIAKPATKVNGFPSIGSVFEKTKLELQDQKVGCLVCF